MIKAGRLGPLRITKHSLLELQSFCFMTVVVYVTEERSTSTSPGRFRVSLSMNIL